MNPTGTKIDSMPHLDALRRPSTPDQPGDSTSIPEELQFRGQVRLLREQVDLCESAIREGQSPRLPGNVAFLEDGRVLCRERTQGDSRYPYGSEGFNFWINASGAMHGNQGLYFLFLPTQEGQDPPISFFAGVRPVGQASFTSHALLPTPFVESGESKVVDRYTVIGHDATYFISETPEILSAVRVFVDQSRPNHVHIKFSVLIENKTNGPLETFAAAYMNPFCRHRFVETNEDCWFKKIHVDTSSLRTGATAVSDPDAGAVLPPFVITTTEDVDRFQSISNYALLRRAVSIRDATTGAFLPLSIKAQNGSPQNPSNAATEIHSQVCTSRLALIGSTRRSLNTAEFLETGRVAQEVPMTVFKENAVVANIARMTLPANCYFRGDHIFSTPDSLEVLEIELDRPLSSCDVDLAFASAKSTAHQSGQLELKVQGKSQLDINAKTFNKFLPFLKKQVAVCALLKGYMHPSANSLIGFRDVLQAIEGHLLDQPDESREKLLEVLAHVLVDGRCPRQYSLPVNGNPGQADLREFIDQGVWAISTVHSYLSVTGDLALLKQRVGYHHPSPTDGATIVQSAEIDSVLDHLIRIMDYLAANCDPETGLVFALYGDWNDALDGLGISSDPAKAFGTGVSVMTSLQLYNCCSEIIDILQHTYSESYADDLLRYKKLQKQLLQGLLDYAIVEKDKQRKVLHGWGDKRSYLVGSFCDSDGLSRDGLTSNAFWILSGMLDQDPTLRADILRAFESLDSKFGLRTFAPGFASDAPGVGRISKLPRGTAENGAVYVHATTFAIAALFKLGEAHQAWKQIEKILPFSSHHKSPSHSTFVMPNSYVDNPQLDLKGQSMNDWQTGCSNVLLKLLVRYVFGFQPGLDSLCISPAQWHPFQSLEFSGIAHGKQVRIAQSFEDVAEREIRLNGEACVLSELDENSRTPSALIPYESLFTDKVNEILVVDPVLDVKPQGI